MKLCMEFLNFIVFCHGLMMALWAETGSLITYYKWSVGYDCMTDNSEHTFVQDKTELSRSLIQLHNLQTRGDFSKASRILNLATACRRVIKFKLRLP